MHPRIDPAAVLDEAGLDELSVLAREAVVAAFESPDRPPWRPVAGALAQTGGVFVTIRDPERRLRGCVGTLVARFDTLAEETWWMAREAAFSDPRFLPVGQTEVSHLGFEVSVLHPLEKIANADELDPRLYGVVISTEDGRRGVLLPDVDGIDSVADQLEICRRKGGIGIHERVKVQRMRVAKYRERGNTPGDVQAPVGG